MMLEMRLKCQNLTSGDSRTKRDGLQELLTGAALGKGLLAAPCLAQLCFAER